MSEQPMTGPISRRKLLALGGGAVAAGALASAFGGSPRSRLASASSTPGTAATTPAGDLPTLSQWYHQYGEEGTEAAVRKYAAAYTKAKVEVNWLADYDNALPAALLTDSGPDVFERGNGPTLDMIKAGQVVDLTDLFTDEVKKDFNQAVLNRVTWEGKIWAVPQMVDMICMVYRKSMLDAAGVKPPETIDEMIAAAKTLTKGDVKGLFVGNDGGIGEMINPMLRSAGLSYVTDDGKVGFDDPKAAEALAKFAQLYKDGSLLEGQDKDWWSPEAFINGACAMQWTGLWGFPEITKALADDWGVFAWPSFTAGGPKVVEFGAFSAMVNGKSKHVDVAKDYVKWLWIDGTDMQIEFNTAFGYHVPARTSLVPQAKPLQDGPAKVAAELLGQYGAPQNHILWTDKSATAFKDAMTNIVKSGADAAGELAKVKATVEGELASLTGGAPAGSTPSGTTPAAGTTATTTA